MTTPIEEARNLGPKSAAALRAAGITTLEELRNIGWEEAIARVIEREPIFINLNFATGLIGAVDGIDWRAIPREQKARARRIVEGLRAALR